MTATDLKGTSATTAAEGPVTVSGPPPRQDRGAGPRACSACGKVVSVLLAVIMVVMLALAAAVVVAPKVLGALPLTVLTGSMEPTFSPGDVVVVRPVEPEDLTIDDIVTFQPVSDDPTLVTHRVAAIHWGSDGVAELVTRGDANTADDDPIVPDQVMGRVVYSIPLIGHVTNASWGPTAVTVGAVCLILYAVVAIVTPERSRPTTQAREAR